MGEFMPNARRKLRRLDFVRVFNRRHSNWDPEVLIHERVKVAGKVHMLEGTLLHWRNPTYSRVVTTFNSNADTEAKMILRDRPQGPSVLAIVFKPLLRFGWTYFLRGGWRCGMRGYIYAVTRAHGEFLSLREGLGAAAHRTEAASGTGTADAGKGRLRYRFEAPSATASARASLCSGKDCDCLRRAKSVVIGSRPSILSRAPVAQLDRVPGYEPGGREFESLRARHLFPTATAAQAGVDLEERHPRKIVGQLLKQSRLFLARQRIGCAQECWVRSGIGDRPFWHFVKEVVVPRGATRRSKISSPASVISFPQE